MEDIGKYLASVLPLKRAADGCTAKILTGFSAPTESIAADIEEIPPKIKDTEIMRFITKAQAGIATALRIFRRY